MEEGTLLICKFPSGVKLTKDKEYTCLVVSENKVVVLDDGGKKNLYYSSRFTVKKEKVQ